MSRQILNNNDKPEVSEFKIILVEDEEGLGRLMQKKLKREGYKVTLAETGNDALKLVEGDRNEILLVDYKLPDMSGKLLVQKLQEKLGFTPAFVTLTGFGNEKIAVEMMKMGSRDYVVKEKDFLEILPHVLIRICNEVNNEIKLEETEAHLKKNLELLNETGELASIGGWEVDLKTNKVFWTDATKKIHDVPDDFIPDLSVALDFFPKGARSKLKKAVDNAIENGKKYSLELPFITAKGESLWVVTKGIPLMENGKCVRLYGIFQDITKRKQTELELKKRTAILKRTEKIAHVGSWDWDVATDTVTWSDEMFQIFKLDRKKGAPSYADHPKIYTPESMKKLDEAVQDCLKTGNPYQVDLEIIRGGGKHAFCTGSGLAKKDENGKVIRLYGSFQDITKRKKDEQNLKESNQQLRDSESQLKETNQQNKKLAFELGERLKEMNCLYSIALIIETPGISLDEILKRSVKTIPPGWQYPDKTSARIVLNGKEYKTDDFRESDTKISEIIRVDGEKPGAIEVFLHDDSDKKKPLAFLKEEKRLLYLIAERLGKVIFRIYASEKLEETTRLLNETENTAKIGGWEFNPKTLKQYWTQEIFRILEIDTTKEEPDVPKGLGFIDSKFRPEAEKAIQNAIENGEPYNLEWLINTAKGNKKWVNAVANPVVENGNVIKVIGSFQDITERKEAEEDLKAAYQQLEASEQQLRAVNQQLVAMNQQLISSEQQLKASNQQLAANEQQLRAANQQLTTTEHQLRASNKQLVENGQKLKKSKETAHRYLNVAAEIILSLDKNGNIKLMNESGHQLLGYKNGELIGENWFSKCLPKTDVKEIRAVFDQIMEGKLENVANYESDIQTKAGEIRTILWHNNILDDENGKITGTLSSGEDITERKHAEDLLAANERKYRSIMDNSSSSVFIKDLNGKYIYINRKFEEMHEISNDEVQSMTDSDLFPENVASQFRGNDQQIVETGNSVNFEEAVPWKGEMKTVLSTKFPLHDKDGKIYAIGGIATDITNRKLAEQKIRDSEEKHRALYQNAPLAYQSLNINGEVKDVNPQWLSILGYEREQVIGKWFGDFLQPDSREKFRKNFARFKKKGRVSGVEFNMLRGDGTGIIVSFEGCIGYDDKGNFRQTYCTFKDITEQKKAEVALTANKEYIESIFRAAPVGIGVVKNRVLQNTNFTITKMTGYKSEELTGKNSLVLYPDKKEFDFVGKEKYRQISEKGFGTVETRWKCKNGKVIDVLLSSTPFDSTDLSKGVTFSALDITERKKAEQKLQESESFLKAIFENSLNAIVVANDQGNYISVNEAAASLFGYKKDELLKMKVSDLRTIKNAGTSRKYTEYLEKGEDSGEFEFITPGGTRKTAFYSAVRIKKDFNLSILYDITERKKAELELIRAKEKAEEADMLKSAFLANMSHEIRTPMNGILGFTDLLKDPELSGEQHSKFIEIIQKSGDRMLETVNALIDISKIETGQVTVNYENTDVSKEVQTLFEFFNSEANQKELEFILENKLPDEKETVRTDKQKLISIMTNLIKNAIKYTDVGIVKIGLERKEGYLQFYVKDSGIGVPKDRQKAIFNRFEQADIKDTRAFQGSGLGLAIVKAYVEMLNGSVGVDSEEGKGSTFWVKLPVKDETKTKQSNPEKEVTQKTKPGDLKILIAEDDSISSRHLTILLKNKVQQFLYSDTGRKTIDLCKKHPDIDLVLMDVKMPDINGYEATHEIRKLNRDVKIIAQTANAMPGERDKALAAGCDEYISKPIDKDELLRLIRKTMKVQK